MYKGKIYLIMDNQSGSERMPDIHDHSQATFTHKPHILQHFTVMETKERLLGFMLVTASSMYYSRHRLWAMTGHLVFTVNQSTVVQY